MTYISSIALTAAAAAPITKGKTEEIKGTDMVGNPKFSLTSDKIYGFGGATVTVNGARFRVSYNSQEYSGAVHDYMNKPSWNGGRLGIGSYKRLHVIIEGDASNTKFELNDTVIFDFGKLKAGDNVVDLEAMKADEFAPLAGIDKINFVNKPGTGSYIVRLVIE